MNRRQFVKTVGAGAAGMALVSQVPFSAPVLESAQRSQKILYCVIAMALDPTKRITILDDGIPILSAETDGMMNWTIPHGWIQRGEITAVNVSHLTLAFSDSREGPRIFLSRTNDTL